MGFGYRWRPSKTAKKAFAEKMDEIDAFCSANGIDSSRSNDSYYFTVRGKNYRVSNHTVEASNKGAFDYAGRQTRPLYHQEGRRDDTIYITASKTRIIEIYKDLKAGRKLDARGNRKAKK